MPPTPRPSAAWCCSCCASAFFSLVLGSTELAAKTFDAGGTVGAGLGLALAEYLNRTGSIIVLLTAMMLSVILATQFSFGRMFATATVGSRDLSARGLGALRGWFDERRRERARREVIAKHTRKTGAPPPVIKPPTPEGARARRSRSRGPSPRPRPRGRRRRSSSRPGRRRRRSLPDPEPPKAPAQRKNGTYTLPPHSLLDASKAERKIDERELMELARQLQEKCREFAVEGQVAQIHPGPGGHHLRVQARRRREVQQGDRARRRPVPGDAGRVGAHRPHPGQVHGRHPDSEPQPRGDLAARAARVRRLPALDLEAHVRARQDDPRRAVLRRPRHDAASADCRLHRARASRSA